MDIGKLKGNWRFEDTDYMPASTITLKLKESPEFCIYVSEDYFKDIFRNPPLDGPDWIGFTRDVCECKGVFGFSGNDWIEMSNPREYLEDMLQRKADLQKKKIYRKTPEVFELIADFLRYAIETGQTVIMREG